MLLQMFERLYNAFPGMLDVLFIAGAIFGGIALHNWWKTRHDFVKKSVHDEVLEKLRKSEEKVALNSSYYPAELLELFNLLGRLFNVPAPTTLRDAIILVLGNVTEFEKSMTALKKISRTVRKDADRQGLTSILQIVDALIASYVNKNGLVDIANVENAVQGQIGDTFRRANERIANENAALNQTLDDMTTRHAELRHILNQIMIEFENIDGMNPLAIKLAEAEGILKGIERANASMENVIPLFRAPAQGNNNRGNNGGGGNGNNRNGNRQNDNPNADNG